jgi:hypothetical protein
MAKMHHFNKKFIIPYNKKFIIPYGIMFRYNKAGKFMIILIFFTKIAWNNFMEYSRNNKWNITGISKIKSNSKSISYDYYSRNIKWNKSKLFILLFLCVYIHRNNNKEYCGFFGIGAKGKIKPLPLLMFF